MNFPQHPHRRNIVPEAARRGAGLRYARRQTPIAGRMTTNIRFHDHTGRSLITALTGDPARKLSGTLYPFSCYQATEYIVMGIAGTATATPSCWRGCSASSRYARDQVRPVS